MKRFWFFIGIFISALSISMAQNINYSIDRDTIKIGEQLKYKLKVTADTSAHVQLPLTKDFLPFEVVKIKSDTTTKLPLRLSVQYLLTAWDSGHYHIPALSVRINDSVFKTDSLSVYVAGVHVDTTKQGLYPLKPAVPFGHKPSITIPGKKGKLPWWFIVLLLLAGGAGLYFYLRKKQILAQQKELSPYEKAIAEWEKLKSGKLLLNNGEQFYVKLTDILRDYLEKALHIPAKESITPELINLLKQFVFENGKKIPEAQINSLAETLKRADLAKFAKEEPLPVYRDKDLEYVKHFIDELQAVLNEIEAEKLRKEAERLALEKNKRRKRAIKLAVLGTFFVLLLSGTFYYFFKPSLKKVWNKNIALLNDLPAEQDWKWVYLGSKPSLEFLSPVVPQADISYYPSDSMANKTEEFALLKEKKGNWYIQVYLFDFKKDVENRQIMNEISRRLKNDLGVDVALKNPDENSMFNGLGNDHEGNKIMVEGKLFAADKKVRVILNVYPADNDFWKKISEKILASAGLKH